MVASARSVLVVHSRIDVHLAVKWSLSSIRIVIAEIRTMMQNHDVYVLASNADKLMELIK